MVSLVDCQCFVWPTFNYMVIVTTFLTTKQWDSFWAPREPRQSRGLEVEGALDGCRQPVPLVLYVYAIARALAPSFVQLDNHEATQPLKCWGQIVACCNIVD